MFVDPGPIPLYLTRGPDATRPGDRCALGALGPRLGVRVAAVPSQGEGAALLETLGLPEEDALEFACAIIRANDAGDFDEAWRLVRCACDLARRVVHPCLDPHVDRPGLPLDGLGLLPERRPVPLEEAGILLVELLAAGA